MEYVSGLDLDDLDRKKSKDVHDLLEQRYQPPRATPTVTLLEDGNLPTAEACVSRLLLLQ